MRPTLILNLLSAEECDRLIELVLHEHWCTAQSGAYLENHARATVANVPTVGETQWLPSRVKLALTRSNVHFKLDIFSGNGPLEDCAIMRYGEGDHVDWHADNIAVGTGMRKLAFTVQLSDPGTYDGGDLEFLPGGVIAMSRTRGAAIVFPAFLCHRVSRVTRGWRYSLVGGALGPPFK
jgi:PKHD-type hydroxylase